MSIYEFTHTERTSAPAEAVWALWADVEHWTEWDSSLQSADLAGPFETGSSGTMAIPGLPPIAFTLVEVERGKAFTDETTVPGAVLRFRHTLTRSAGRTEVTHEVRIDGEHADELGPAVTADVPEAVRALVKLAETRSAA
jgi:hypothetical protein